MESDLKKLYISKRGIRARQPDSNHRTVLLDLPNELQIIIILFIQDLATIEHLRLSCRRFKSLCDDKKKLITTLLREHITTTILDYYNLLTTLHIPSADILLPPSGGWQSDDYYPNDIEMSKTDFTIMVTKHLPYIYHQGESYCHRNIDVNCLVLDRSYSYFNQPVDDYDFYEDTSQDEVAEFEDMIVLASGPETWDMNILLDTRNATVWESTNMIRSSPIPIDQYFNKRKRDLIEGRKLFIIGARNSPWSLPDNSAPYDEKEFLSKSEPSLAGKTFGIPERMHWLRHLYFTCPCQRLESRTMLTGHSRILQEMAQ